MFATHDSTPGSVPFDAGTVDARSDEELDALPFGVVCLDDAGVILRYNLYESRFARLDRNDVLGRDFFREVARCTRTPEFEGRFRAFVEAAGATPVARFSYLFDFAFGAQEVSVEIVRARGAPRNYLLIDRVRVEGPRPSFPREKLAIAQRDLSPAGEEQGVRRDDVERRFVQIPTTFLAAFRATCDRLAPESWALFAHEWGVQWGRRLAIELEAYTLENLTSSLSDLPMRRAGAAIADHLRALGLGAFTFDYAHAGEGIVALHVERSALAEAVRRTRRTEGELACPLLAGCVGGVLSSLANRRLVGREVACIGGGADRCTHVVVAHERRAAVDQAIASGARGLPAVREALRAAPPRSSS
jgi:photoactive yellow protein